MLHSKMLYVSQCTRQLLFDVYNKLLMPTQRGILFEQLITLLGQLSLGEANIFPVTSQFNPIQVCLGHQFIQYILIMIELLSKALLDCLLLIRRCGRLL